MNTRIAVAVAVSALALGLAATPAHAAFRGANGAIASAFFNDDEDVGILLDHTDLTPDSELDYAPAFSPDGSRIAFTSTRGGDEDIYVMDRDGSHQLRLTSNSGNDSTPAFSADGSTVVFTSDRDGNRELYTINADGTDETRLTTTAANEQDPAVSPDGTRLAYASDLAGNRDIYIANADASTAVRLTDNAADDFQPNIAPDGSRIAFTSTRDNQIGQIYVMHADGTATVNLSRARWRYDTHPSFSPDGTKIAFAWNGLCGPDAWGCAAIVMGGIYVMNSDGSSDPTTVSDAGAGFDPDWSIASQP